MRHWLEVGKRRQGPRYAPHLAPPILDDVSSNLIVTTRDVTADLENKPAGAWSYELVIEGRYGRWTSQLGEGVSVSCALSQYVAQLLIECHV